MKEENQPKSRQAFLQLLEKLQQDSWQLELLISGFVIFLLIGAYQPLQDLKLDSDYLRLSIVPAYSYQIPVMILFLGWIFLLFNLFLHVLLRGLWISTIGLRYVSGDIDYNSLRYVPRFKSFLQKRIGTFDRYIERLENICSIIFAFTFLIIFVFLSMGLYILILGLIMNSLKGLRNYLYGPEGGIWITAIPAVFLLLFGLLYFLDFISLGFFKRSKWFSWIYMPVYRIMSLITLSFLYRPIYYNLIDNKFGRWVGYLLVPYIIILLIVFSFTYETHPYFPEGKVEHITFDRKFYDSQRDEDKLVANASIPDPYVKNGFIELFVPYIPVEEDSVLTRVCPDFKPHKRTRLRSTAIKIDLNSRSEIASKNDSAFQCLMQIYQVIIDDSIYNDLSYYLFEHPNHQERGLKSVIDVSHLDRGEHQLIVNHRDYIRKTDSLFWEKIAFIPFWKE